MKRYFMSQKQMREARWRKSVMLSIAKRENLKKAYVSFYGQCGCGCGALSLIKS